MSAHIVNIPDTELRSLVINRLNKNEEDDITENDMLQISGRFDITSNNISDLTGLEYATNITQMRINENDITNISPLSTLTNLIELAIVKNEVSDLTPLSALTNLTELQISSSEISDITPLNTLVNLEMLELEWNRIVDISTLESLTNIRHLSTTGNMIVDLEPLVNNSGLGVGDRIILFYNNSLNKTSTETYIPALRQRGVIVDRAFIYISTITPDVHSGQSFDVRIFVDDIVDLSAWKFDITYSNNIEFITAKEGDFFRETSEFFEGVSSTIDDRLVQKNIAAVLIGGKTQSGSGLLTTLTFKSTNNGHARMDLSGTETFNNSGDRISDSDNNISFTIYHAQSSIRLLDINNDGVVDSDDLDLIISHYGTNNTISDFDDDNIVSIKDVLKVANKVNIV